MAPKLIKYAALDSGTNLRVGLGTAVMVAWGYGGELYARAIYQSVIGNARWDAVMNKIQEDGAKEVPIGELEGRAWATPLPDPRYDWV